MKTIYARSVSWFRLQSLKQWSRPAMLATAMLAVTASLHADYYFQPVDDPQSSVGASNSSVTGINGSNVIGSYTDGTNNYSFLFTGTSYLILNDTNSVIPPGTLAVGSSTAGIVGNYGDSNTLNYGFLTIDGINFTTIDPSGTGSTMIGGISGTTIYGNTGSNSDAFFTSVANPANSTPVIINGAQPGGVQINGAASGGQIFGTYLDMVGNSLGFITPDGSTIQSVGVTNSDGVQSLLGVTPQGLIIGTYENTQSNTLGFITPDGTNITTITGPSNALSGSVTLLGVAGNAALGTYTSTNNSNAAFLTLDGIGYSTLTNGPANTPIDSVVGYLGGFVIGNYDDPLSGNTFGFGALPGGGVSVPITGPNNAGWSSLSISNVFGSVLAGQYNDSMGNLHNFVAFPSTGNNSISVTNYITVDGPPNGTSITGVSGSNSIGFYVDLQGNTNWFLSANGYLPINPPNVDPTTISLLGISGNSAVGTYTDTNSGNTYAFTSADGTNYTTIVGPDGTNGSGINQLDSISGSSIAGTYTSTNNDTNGAPLIYGYLTQNGGSSYTILKGPPGYDGSSIAVAGVSGTIVVGTYSDANGNGPFGFQNSTKVVGPGGVNSDGSSTLATVDGITASGKIVGTYNDPISGVNVYGFIGTGIIKGPYGTNGAGINEIDAISGNQIAGTYTDQNNNPNATNPGTGFTYGYITSDGVNYMTVAGPSDSIGGIATINFLSSNTVVGTYSDTNSVTHFFAYDGVAYTILDEPQAQLDQSGNSLTTVNGISGKTVFGTYTDNFGLTHGFNVIQRSTQSITFGGTLISTFGLPFTLNGIDSAGLPITYTVLSGPATISNNVVTFTGTGKVTVVASQPGTPFFSPTSATNTVTVNKASQVIGNFTIPNTVFGAPPLLVNLPVASSGLQASLSSLSTNAIIAPSPFNQNQVLVSGLGAGTVTLAANQSGNTNYNAALQVTSSFVISKAPQSISSFEPLKPQPFGTNFTVSAPSISTKGANSGNPVTLSILSGPATISSNTVTTTGVGIIQIAANLAGSANYLPASQVTTTVQITQASQTIGAFNLPQSLVFGTSFTVTNVPTASSGLPVTLSILSGPGTISANKTIIPTGTGTIVLAASQTGNSNYAAAPQVTIPIAVTPASQTLGTFGSITAKTFGSPPFLVVAPKPVGTNSGQAVVLSVLSTNATIAGNLLTITGAGTVTLAADLASNANFAAAMEVTTNFIVSPGTQTIGAWSPIPAKTYGIAPFSVTPPIASSGLTPVVSVVSGPASASNNVLTLAGAGTVTLSASVPASQNYNASSNSITTFVVNKSSQLISFPTIANVVGTDPVTITNLPTSSSGLPVTVTVLSGPATYDSNQNVVTLTGTNGTVVLAANQSGDTNYLAAPQVKTSFSYGKIDQSLTPFTSISDMTYFPGTTLTISNPPTASSGLTNVVLSVLSGPATILGNVVSITGAGTVVLAADQAGDSTFGPAAEVTTSFNVAQATQSINPLVGVPTAFTYGNTVGFQIPISTSGLPTTLTAKGAIVTLVTVNGRPSSYRVTPTGFATNIVLAADQSGNSNYLPAPELTTNIPVLNVPQSIAPFVTIPTQSYGSNATVSVTPPAASSGLTPTLKVLSGPATISGTTVTLAGVGSVVIAANAPASGAYAAAPQVTTSFAVVKAAQNISSFSQISDVPFGTSPFTITPPSADSGLSVKVTVLSGPATIANNVVTVKGAGMVTLAANQPGNPLYNAASQVTTSFNVTQASQSINTFSLTNRVYSTAPFTITPPTASSGLPVTLTVLSGPATIAGNKVTLTGIGTVIIAANQAGNPNYSAAQSVPASFNVTQIPQTIAPFATIATKTFGAAPFSITPPTANSGLPVTVTVFSGPATITGNKVTLTGKGTVVLAANQGGNTFYLPATQVVSLPFLVK